MLKIPDTAFFGLIDKAFEQGEIESILSVDYLDTDKLCRHTLTADRCVQRRSETRGQYHIHAVFGGGGGKVAEYLPKTLREHLNAVGIAKAVAMEPVGVHQLLLR